eukprot:7003091-Prymnesium_polylepis.1
MRGALSRQRSAVSVARDARDVRASLHGLERDLEPGAVGDLEEVLLLHVLLDQYVDLPARERPRHDAQLLQVLTAEALVLPPVD